MVQLNFPIEQLAEICRRSFVKELSIFGSTARGEQRPDSDIDLLVEFEPGARIGFIAFSRLNHELAELLDRPVDLVTKRGLHPLLRNAVLADARVIFAK